MGATSFRFRLVAVVAAAVLVGCAAPTGERPSLQGDTSTTDGLASNAAVPPSVASASPSSIGLPHGLVASADVAKAFESTVDEDGLRRWGKSRVTVSFRGAPTAIDRTTLQGAIDWLATVPNVPPLSVVADNATADIRLHVLPKPQWSNVLGTTANDDSGVTRGVTLARWNGDGTLTGADVVVDVNDTQPTRNRAIVHELLHAVGIGHHACAGGLVYGGADGALTWEPTTFDTALVTLTYDRGLRGGMHGPDVAKRVKVEGTEPTCPPVRFVGYRAPDGGELWCLKVEGTAPCYAVDGTVVPTLASPIEYWVRSGVLTRYDPTRYVEYRSPDGTVLCEVRTGPKRVPCQRGSGLREITRVDLWTDGTTLYDKP